jgi:hypothetical protein
VPARRCQIEGLISKENSFHALDSDGRQYY